MSNSSATATQEKASLANWRLPPYNRWAFENLRELIPSAEILAAKSPIALVQSHADVLDALELSSCGGNNLDSFLIDSFSDSLLVLHDGRKVWQWRAAHCEGKAHLLMSVSKSITAILAGMLTQQKLLDVARTLVYYLPGCKGSAYADCTVQQLLDMQVALKFNESYLDATGDYKRYRDATGWNPVDQLNPGPDLENFLYSLGKADHEHGQVFSYNSPNSDLLGLLIERVAGVPYAEFISARLWQPMGAETNAYVMLDRSLLARGAGGICASIEDLARIGQLILDGGYANNQQIISASWIEDTWRGGNRDAWAKGDFVSLLPGGCYRNQWYLAGDRDQAGFALGIHGQWLYINPTRALVIAKLSSHPQPLDDAVDLQTLKVFAEIGAALD